MASQLVFFILPLLLAGVVHHFLVIPRNWFKYLQIPIDGGKKWNGKPILGPAKTWRGVVVMVVATGLFTALMSHVISVEVTLPSVVVGSLLGLGYSLGEIPNSLFKRQRGISVSQKNTGVFGVIDHCDSILGATILLPLFYNPSWQLVMVLIVMGTGIHWGVDQLLYNKGYKASQ